MSTVIPFQIDRPCPFLDHVIHTLNRNRTFAFPT
jgi:hypothetical protein